MKKAITYLLLCLTTLTSASAQCTLTHPWQGKRVAYFGDSITDPRNNAAKNKYWSYLEDWLGITPFVYGISGRQWNDIPHQADKLKQDHGDDFDAIMIFIGTNDYNNAVPLGRWYNEKLESVEYGHGYEKRPENRLRRIPNMDSGTYRGRINIALDSLKRLYPTKQIVLLTPIHRGGFYANEKNWQCPEDYVNRCGEYLDSYVEATKEAGGIWAVPVIDINSLCGLYPIADGQAQYFHDPDSDRLHPNDSGHRRIATTLMYQLLTIPCTF